MSGLHEDLSITTIGGGDAVKQVDYQLQEAIKNCLDPNTEVKKNRVVTLKMTLMPNNDRTSAELEFMVDTKFPGDAAGVDSVSIVRSTKKGYVPSRQMKLGDLDEDEETITDPETGEVMSFQKRSN